MGLFKKIKDIFSNDKGKETNTQENVSLPSSINVPQQSTKQPLVMPGVTEVIKASRVSSSVFQFLVSKTM